MRQEEVAGFAALVANALRSRGFAVLRGLIAALRGRGAWHAVGADHRAIPVFVRASFAVRRTVIATGRHAFSSPGSSQLRLRLTRAGKRLIRKASRLNVEIRIRFVPRSGSALSVVRRMKVTRRGDKRAHAGRDRARSASAGRVLLRWGTPRTEGHGRAAETSR